MQNKQFDQNVLKTMTDEDLKRNSQIEKTYKTFKTFNDPRFGEIIVLQNPQTRDIIFCKEKKINEKNDAFKQIINNREKIARKSNYFLTLIDYSVTKQSQLCSSFYIFKLFYKYPKNDLKKEFLERQKSGKPFTNEEMTHLFYQIMHGFQFIHSNSILHGDIQPILVSYDAQTCQSQIIESQIDDLNIQKIIQIQKARLLSNQPIYQSPLMYSNLKKGNLKFTFDPKKEDSFALGLIFLEAGLGSSVQEIYNQNSPILNQEKLQKLIDRFDQKFSSDNTLVTSAVVSLLNESEDIRPTPDVILDNIPKYEEVIDFLKISKDHPELFKSDEKEKPKKEETFQHNYPSNDFIVEIDKQSVNNKQLFSAISSKDMTNDFSVHIQNSPSPINNNVMNYNVIEPQLIPEKVNYLQQYEEMSKKNAITSQKREEKLMQNQHLEYKLPPQMANNQQNNYFGNFSGSNQNQSYYLPTNQLNQPKINQIQHGFVQNLPQNTQQVISFAPQGYHKVQSYPGQISNQTNFPVIKNDAQLSNNRSYIQSQPQITHYSQQIYKTSPSNFFDFDQKLVQAPPQGQVRVNSRPPSSNYYSQPMMIQTNGSKSAQPEPINYKTERQQQNWNLVNRQPPPQLSNFASNNSYTRTNAQQNIEYIYQYDAPGQRQVR